MFFSFSSLIGVLRKDGTNDQLGVFGIIKVGNLIVAKIEIIKLDLPPEDQQTQITTSRLLGLIQEILMRVPIPDFRNNESLISH